jgi:hypothetical protein
MVVLLVNFYEITLFFIVINYLHVPHSHEPNDRPID